MQPVPEIEYHNYWEHAEAGLIKTAFPKDFQFTPRPFDNKSARYCFSVREAGDHYFVKADYFIGVDWLREGYNALVIAPKLNTRYVNVLEEQRADKSIEIDNPIQDTPDKGGEIFIDYFAMLNQCLGNEYLYENIDDLVKIDWEATEIPIEQEQDWFSPLLIVKFLKVLQSIVRKGLKKSYYKTIRNLNSKVKGKILVGANIKENLLKNKFTNTICQVEEFGINNTENRLLKKAFDFAIAYLDSNKKIFAGSSAGFMNIINYCRAAFEPVSSEIENAEIKQFKTNPFFKEYREGIQLAKLILKRYAYNISNTSREKLSTPPYWIDMPKLFELYAYYFLKTKFTSTNEVKYHLRTYGNELDFLINSGDLQMVADAKYKPLYVYGKNHNDIRQVAGYARLNIVYDKLQKDGTNLVDCLIIYPDMENGFDTNTIKTVDLKAQAIKGYKNIYKVGIKLPRKI